MCIKWNELFGSMAEYFEGTKCDGLKAIRERCQLASKLLTQAQHLRIGGNVKGVQRVERKIKAEKAFLDTILSGERVLRDTHLSSTNLTHIESVLHIVQETEDPVAVQQCFTLVPGLGISPVGVQVDVVAGGGGRWVRVFCRKRSALHRRWLGDGQFGEKSVGEIATEYIEASKQNLHNFQPPRIFFVFFDGITESISGVLKKNGIEVVGPVYSDDSSDETPSVQHVISLLRESMSTQSSLQLPHSISTSAASSTGNSSMPEIERVNLDVSSMLAWVSSLTHGGAMYTLQERILNEQAEEERKSPLWPILQRVTTGKKLMACRTAAEGFSEIVGKVGGDSEKTRARALLDEVEVVDDCPSSRAVALTISHRITHRAKVVFGSGDTLHAMTLTANAGFVRAASHQGVDFTVYIHPSRALTEVKQIKPDKT